MRPGTVTVHDIFTGQFRDVVVELLGFCGPVRYETAADENIYPVLLPMNGKGRLSTVQGIINLVPESIVRVPFNRTYVFDVARGCQLHVLRIRKLLNEKDKKDIIRQEKYHTKLYAPLFSDCPAYKEAIKSPKTLNRMLLPENYVPRFCMGSVETTGPDTVGAHEHPMLDQIFFGLKKCRGTLHANEAQAPIVENGLLHIPLGSRHGASVKKGNRLYYIWMDFFLTLEGQSYMSEKHQIIGRHKK
jgi:hypothetical protein